MISITKQCPFSGMMNTLELPITMEEFEQGMAKWDAGAYIQHAFPTLSPEQREFIMTGITPDVWRNTFRDDDA